MSATYRRPLLFLTLVAFQCGPCAGYAPSGGNRNTRRDSWRGGFELAFVSSPHCSLRAPGSHILHGTAEGAEKINGINGAVNGADAPAAVETKPEDCFPMAEILEFELEEHKPLGCTAEESLAEELDGAKHVFVAKVKEGGNAEKAGLQEGDVIVGLSGTFDDVINVVGLGLDRVRSLVGGRLEEEPLVVRVARGTDVKERHESTIVDLCVLPGGTDEVLEKCLNVINGAEMNFEDDMGEIDCTDDDVECMIDAMYQAWDEDMPTPLRDNKEDEEEEEAKPKVEPWRSRSSGSGTYVRDPKTGEMRNIDEQ